MYRKVMQPPPPRVGVWLPPFSYVLPTLLREAKLLPCVFASAHLRVSWPPARAVPLRARTRLRVLALGVVLVRLTLRIRGRAAGP